MVSLSHTTDDLNDHEDPARHYDPAILQAARRIYRQYFATRAQIPADPVGVAINKHTYRGQLLFTNKPILLPGECLISLGLLENAD